MFAPEPSKAAASSALPLGFPAELWSEMSEQYQSACTSAQALLQAFGSRRTLDLRAISRRAGIGIAEALEGLRVLDGMELVQIQAGDTGPVVTLLAIPEDHVRIVAPDGSVRWVFIARPLDAPDVDPLNLN